VEGGRKERIKREKREERKNKKGRMEGKKETSSKKHFLY
jgi:hypothetical protein